MNSSSDRPTNAREDASEARARRAQEAILASLTDGAIATDSDGMITFLNGAASRMTGRAVSDAVGKPIAEVVRLVGGPNRKPVECPVTRALRDAPPTRRATERHTLASASGDFTRVEVTTTRLTADAHQLEGAVVILRSEVATAAREEVFREEHFRQIVEEASDGIFIADARGNYLDVNAAGCAMLGYTREEILRMGISDLLAPEEMVRVGPEVARLQNEHSARSEWRFRRKNGTFFFGEIHARQLHDSRLLALLRDTSDRKHAVEVELKMRDQRRQAQKMEALGTLASGVAHDFNNILSVILLNAELAAQDIDPSHPALVCLRDIDLATRRGRDVAARILTFGRMQPLKREVLDLRQEVREVLLLLRPATPAGVELVTAFGSDVAPVLADRTQLQQVLMNLCNNAVQAMHEARGKITIAVETSPPEDGVPTAHEPLTSESCVRLSVCDDGAGMDEATAARVFDPFFTTRAAGGGTGLGLALVHGIVEAHGGVIRLQTKPGYGSTFHVYLPATETADEATRNDERPIPPRGRGELILYVDDEEWLVSVASKMLKRLGYRVRGYTSPREALIAFHDEPSRFSLAILDLTMPEYSGIEVAEELLRIRPDTPIALVSGNVTDAVMQRARSLGVRQILNKPMSAEQLAETVQELCSDPRRRPRDAF